jgi:FHA domain
VREEAMTKKRDLKRRVRARPAQTGESYVTARRQVVAPRQARTPMVVTEVEDVTAEAARLGFACQVRMSPDLVARAAPAEVLASLRDVLGGGLGVVDSAVLFGVAFGIAPPPPAPPPVIPDLDRLRLFLRRARAGMGGVSEDGTVLAWHVHTRRGAVPVLCSIAGARGLMLGVLHGEAEELRPGAAAVRGEESQQLATQLIEAAAIRALGASPRPGTIGLHTGAARLRAEAAAVAATAPAELWVTHDGKHYPVGRGGFVIGRQRPLVDLAIRDGLISRRHAEIVWRAGHYYIRDLGSLHGLTFRGVRIDEKQLDDGDEIGLGGYVLAFSFTDPG